MSTLKTNNIQHVDRSDPSIIINTDGSVNIAGTMTYEDVTNVDAVGIITGRELINAQKQVHVGTGVSVKAGGLNVTAGITTVQALQATTGTFSGVVKIPDGSTSAPSLAASSDTNSGLYFAGADALGLVVGGSRKLLANSSGVTINNGDLTIDDKIIHQADTDTAIRFPAANTFTVETAGSERIRIDSSGDIGIGTATVTADAKVHIVDTGTGVYRPLVVEGSATNGSVIEIRNNGAERIRIGSGGSNNLSGSSVADGLIRTEANMLFAVGNSEKVRIDSSGRLRIASTTESADGAFDDLIIGNNSGNRGISILSANGQQGALGFGKSGTLADGYLAYVHNSTPADSAMTLKSSGTIRFHAASVERIRIDDYGVLRVGNTHDQTTSGNTKRIALGAKASIWGWASGQINGALTLADNYYWDGANNKAIESDYSAYLTLRSGSLRFGATASTQTGGSNISGGISEKVRFQQGGGISFNGDTAAANALDDYEEGIITWASLTSGITFNSSYKGRYTKIGELVTVSGYLLLSSFTSSSNIIKIQLPFTSAANGEGYYTRGVGATFSRQMNFPANYHNMVAYVGGGENYIRFFMTRNTGGSSDWHQMVHSNLTSTSAIYFNVCYTTTS